MTYNEAGTLREVAEELLAVVASLPGTAELVIIDDGSNDGSGAIADLLAREQPRVRVLHHPRNLGLGGVYRSGFASAKGRYLSFFPADGQFPAGILSEFYSSMESADLVLGYLPTREGALIGRALSLLERLAYRVLLGPMPRFQGVFMVRVETLRAIPLRSQGPGWGIVMEMILRISRGGYRVTTRATTCRPRRLGRSKVTNARSAWANLLQIVLLRQLLQRDHSSDRIRAPG